MGIRSVSHRRQSPNPEPRQNNAARTYLLMFRHNMKKDTVGKQKKCTEFARCDFMRWRKSLKRSREEEDLESFTIKSKLALTAFVNSLIKAHKIEFNQTKGGTCNQNIHNCIYNALRLCYELDLWSTKIVSELIREIFLCEGNLHSIFSIIEGHVTWGIPSNGNVNIHTFTLYPRANSKNFKDVVLPALAYYVKNIVKLDRDEREDENLRYDPHTLLNSSMNGDQCSLTPLMAATRKKDPDLVLLLLRYGADPTVLNDLESTPVNPIQYIVKCLNSVTSLRFSSWLEKLKAETESSLAAQGENCQKILKMFQRTVHHINLQVTTGLWSDKDELAYYIHPRLPDFWGVSTTEMPTLQHLSRVAIRKHIMVTSREAIPVVVSKLPVPYIMQEFLDLKC